MANDFLGEEIYMFKELKIPFTFGKVYESFVEPDDEATKRQFAIEFMSNTLKQAYPGQKEYKKEAKYYLEMNNYNLDKALTEFEADLEFEKKVVKENKDHNRRKRRDKLGIFA